MNYNLTTLRILQYNVRRSKDVVMAPLLRDPTILDYDVIAIQEPWIDSYTYTSHNPITNTFVLWLPKSGNKPPKVAFYTNKRLDHSCISFTSHSNNLATITISYEGSQLHIHNTYNQPTTEEPTSILRQLALVAHKHQRHEQLIVGDFNMEGPEWALEDLGDRGSARQGLPYFRELLETEGLEVILPQGTITREEGNAASTIDLAICNRRAMAKLLECKRVDQLDHHSDHWPIHTILQIQPKQAMERPPIKLWKRTPVKTFCQRLQDRLPVIAGRLTNDDVSRLMAEVVTALADTIEDTVPTSKPDTTVKHTPGFTVECKAKCREVQRLRRAWQHTKNEEDWKAYAKARNAKGNAVRKALSETHRERVELACQSPAGLWGLAKWARTRGLTIAQRVTPTIEGHDTHEGKIAALSEAFFPTPPPITSDRPPKIPLNSDFECPPLTRNEIRQAILRPHPHKAPGPTGIPNHILRISMDVLLPLLHPLFNFCLFRGICPFKDSTTVVLKKPNKEDYSKAKAYRPIALLETLGKALESAIAERISYYVETHQLLPEDHIGARKTRSTEHAIHTLLERIYKAHEQADKGYHRVATLLMLDASGAFDNVHHNRLVECLARRRLPAPVVVWIREWLRDRRTKLRLPEGESDWISLKYGIPQGSSLSPILWLFYNADLLDEILGAADSQEVSTTAWVDDTGILIVGNTAAENCRILEQIHYRAANWATRYGCVFAPDKYEIMHFHTDRTKQLTSPTPAISLSDECLRLPETAPIAPTTKLRHLGVWFDPALVWNHHIEAIKAKVRKSIQALKAISGSEWGCTTLQLRQLYKAIIVPQITYCSSVWYQPHDKKALPTGTTRKHLVVLQELQKEALVVVTGGIRLTAGLALALEMHVLPVELQLLQANHMAYLRLKGNPLTRSYGDSRSDVDRETRWQSPLTRLGIHHKQYHATPLETIQPHTVPPWWQPVSTTIASNDVQAKANHRAIWKEYCTRSLILYTDGSGYKGGVGASAYMPTQPTARISKERTAYLGPLTQSTVYLGELQGISMALDLAQRSYNRRMTRIDIFTDNQAAIASTEWPSRQSGQYVLRQIAEQITALKRRQLHIHIHWIPAHTGVEGNEKADALAKAAAERRATNTATTTGTTTAISTATSNTATTTIAAQQMLAKQVTRTRWEAAWEASTAGRVLYRWQPVPSKKTLLKYRGLKRAVAAVLFQMRTGKIGLNDYLWHIHRAESPLCTCGEGRQTVRHVLLDCNNHRELRREVWEAPGSGWNGLSSPTNIKAIWENPQLAKTAAIYMLRTGLLGQFTRPKSSSATDSNA